MSCNRIPSSWNLLDLVTLQLVLTFSPQTAKLRTVTCYFVGVYSRPMELICSLKMGNDVFRTDGQYVPSRAGSLLADVAFCCLVQRMLYLHVAASHGALAEEESRREGASCRSWSSFLNFPAASNLSFAACEQGSYSHTAPEKPPLGNFLMLLTSNYLVFLPPDADGWILRTEHSAISVMFAPSYSP